MESQRNSTHLSGFMQKRSTEASGKKPQFGLALAIVVVTAVIMKIVLHYTPLIVVNLN